MTTTMKTMTNAGATTASPATVSKATGIRASANLGTASRDTTSPHTGGAAESPGSGTCSTSTSPAAGRSRWERGHPGRPVLYAVANIRTAVDVGSERSGQDGRAPREWRRMLRCCGYDSEVHAMLRMLSPFLFLLVALLPVLAVPVAADEPMKPHRLHVPSREGDLDGTLWVRDGFDISV